MRVVPIPCLRDNYAYLAFLEGARDAIVVDPSEAQPVLRAAEVHGVVVRAVLATHHHADHVGGIEELWEALGPLPVFAHESEQKRIGRQDQLLSHGESFEIAGLQARALHVPGHTRGALAYQVGGALFTGDTLFGAGCGRLFEGTPAQMWSSLALLRSLPGETQVYFGHEYTLANLAFASHCEPTNADVKARIVRARARLAAGQGTVPSTLAEELQTNPFLRADDPGLASRWAHAAVGPVDVFAALRSAKDTFPA